ncbi:Protein HID1 [Hypsibius exemplaris]|uniref:Protein HID1 n=1 Tax=Hypsibius exemplaris TaxID=2072580 RepID=A0A1W0WSI7_HYPEX|nr:Protein HID1 [Hypsibius exemplaris]
MGNVDSKVGFRKAIIDLRSKDKVVEPEEESFWQQFWKDQSVAVQDVFSLVSAEDIRAIREDSPRNFATLAFKCVDQIRKCMESSCSTPAEQQNVLNCVRLLTRLLPFFLEEAEWRSFFWSALPPSGKRYGPFNRFSTSSSIEEEASSSTPTNKFADAPVLATTLMNSLSTLLFCPGFTVAQHKKASDEAEDLVSLDSCEYIWEAGVGFSLSPAHNAQHDQARIEILRLLLTCFSETIYNQTVLDGLICPNRWLEYFTSMDNNRVLPLFTSLLNVAFAYDPVGYGMPYNYMLFGDTKEPLAEICVQTLIVCLDHVWSKNRDKTQEQETESAVLKNMFINYLSRIHREEDFSFMATGFIRLLNNPLQHSYLPSSTKRIQFHQELLVLFWKCCEYNKRFLYHVLKSCIVLDILIPLLYYLNEARQSPARAGLIHLGVFILLLLSGERNFGVRLNKPYLGRTLPDIPGFNGNHADLIILVFHRLITSGHSKLQPLFDCLLTIILNISPYVKSLAMQPSAMKLMHLFEAFSTPWFLYANSTNHHLVFFLLETFNNIVQYQFDGNVALVYCIIRKRALFHALANLPMDHAFIDKTVSAKKFRKLTAATSVTEESDTTAPPTPTTPTPPTPPPTSEPSGLQVSLPVVPDLSKMTGKISSSGEGFFDDQKEPPSVSGASTEDTFENLPSPKVRKSTSMSFGIGSPINVQKAPQRPHMARSISTTSSSADSRLWLPTPEWVQSWKSKLPLTTVMRLLQVLVPQVEKICIDKNITDENEILKFLQRGTLVGLLPVPHALMIRRYQSNSGTSLWVRNYVWGLLYLRHSVPPIWLGTKVTLFDVQSL